MRVISGVSRGTKLKTIESNTTRPTLDRVKESLFNILQNDLKDAIVLDLFAGSGALGIEALSRGAKKAYFCDKNIEAVKVIKENLVKTRLLDKAIVFYDDYANAIKKIKEKISIVFLDPPYKLDLAVSAINELIKQNLITKDSLIIIETDEINRDIEEVQKIEKIEIIDKRKYGRANLIFIKLAWAFLLNRRFHKSFVYKSSAKRKRKHIMEIFTLLENLEENIENSKKVPFTNKIMIEQDEILDVIKEIRLKLPEDLKQAKWVREERERILEEAKKEANDVVKEAENRIISMIDEHEITKKAYEQKNQIMEAANENSRQITQGAKEYADNILADLEKRLEKVLKEISQDRKELK